MSAYDNRKCYGFVKTKDSEFVVDAQESAVVVMIFDCFLNGQSLSQIAAMLESKGIPSPSGKATWSRKVLSSLLSNKKYHIHGLLRNQTFDMAQIEKDHRNGNGDANICGDKSASDDNTVEIGSETTVQTNGIKKADTEKVSQIAFVCSAAPKHQCTDRIETPIKQYNMSESIILFGIQPDLLKHMLVRKVDSA